MKISNFVLLLAILLLAPSAQAAGSLTANPAGTLLPPGSIYISAHERALYFVIDQARAIRYPVAVPKAGKGWDGYARVNGKYESPAWSPPADVRRDHPELPDVIPGGAPNNPMGAAAITLDRTEIAIHGTTRSMRKSIGTAASYGCVRMYNEDVTDLFQRVHTGALVLMAN